jgi:serine/threonine-protein kinase
MDGPPGIDTPTTLASPGGASFSGAPPPSPAAVRTQTLAMPSAPPRPAVVDRAPPAAPSGSKFSAATVGLALVILIGAGIGGTVAYFRYQHAEPETAHTPTATAITAHTPPSATTATAAVTVDPTPAPTPVASAPAPAVSAVVSASAAPAPRPVEGVAADMGVVRTAGASPGRRIFVDEKTVGQTPQSVTTKCGVRQIRLGSSGKTQSIDVPCGGEITVGDK